ncbi:MAG: RidA family protein [Paludibacteraceae bacterium]|nr:RidA family protein [Paludibacteraceae bacterium]
MRQVISTENAPAAIGPYSQAILSNGTLYASGQIPINPKSGNIEGDNIVAQTKQVMENIGNLLKAAGFTYDDVVKTTVFISDMALFGEFNETYKTYFSQTFPARSCVAVKGLPKNALLEIECVACK